MTGYLDERFRAYKRGEIKINRDFRFGYVFRKPEPEHAKYYRQWGVELGLRDMVPSSFMEAPLVRDRNSPYKKKYPISNPIRVIPVRVEVLPREAGSRHEHYRYRRLVLVCEGSEIQSRIDSFKKRGLRTVEHVRSNETYLSIKLEPTDEDIRVAVANIEQLLEHLPYIELREEKWRTWI